MRKKTSLTSSILYTTPSHVCGDSEGFGTAQPASVSVLPSSPLPALGLGELCTVEVWLRSQASSFAREAGLHGDGGP